MCNSFQVVVRRDTQTHRCSIHVFMIIVRQSSEIWKIIEPLDRHAQLKTILPSSYVVCDKYMK